LRATDVTSATRIVAARLEYVSRDRFDLSYHRHTGEWYCLYQRITLNEALALIADGMHFQPC
jgi:hypothetical protein